METYVEKREDDRKIEYRISSLDDYNQYKSKGYLMVRFNKDTPGQYVWAVGGCYGDLLAVGVSESFAKLKAMHEAQQAEN